MASNKVPKVGTAAQTILDECEAIPEETRTFLQGLVDAPHYEPEEDPDVIVTFEYENYRQGSFITEACITLSHYLAVACMNPKFYWSDVLGKHSEIEANAREFEVRFCFDVDERMPYDCCLDEWQEKYDELDEKLIKAANEYVKVNGPYLPFSEFDFQRALDELSQSVPKKKAKK